MAEETHDDEDKARVDASPIVVVSNRGPLTFRHAESAGLVVTRGGGGLVATIAPNLANTGGMWIATASGEEGASENDELIETGGFRVLELALKPEAYRQYYDIIANGTLWFLHHNMFDLARRPLIDRNWWAAWHTYVEVNQAFADAVIQHAPQDAIIMVHDYHLTLLGKALREARPDLRTVHFNHTPFAGKNTINVLPPTVVRQLLEGLAGHTACGFHSHRWASNFHQCCENELGYAPYVFVSAAAPDVEELRKVAQLPGCYEHKALLDAQTGDRKLIVRVDRMELSKNIVRGFLAFDDLLENYPRWRERVIFASFLYPSRQELAEYLEYRKEVEQTVVRLNEKWGTESWTPIMLHTTDNFPQSVAALARYDVLLVNPIRDGLNLVAKEGPMVNERNGAVVLSREAGSWHELSDAAIGINPFDIAGTGDALLHALEMSDEERVARAEQLRLIALKRSPRDWFDDQLRAAGAFA